MPDPDATARTDALSADVPGTPEDLSEPRAEGSPDDAQDDAEARRAAQLARLLDRMTRHADFPSLKESIRGIQKVSRSDLAHQRALTDEVLQDVALTNKLLRLINTAYYSSAGGGSITTVSRAVALMGFQSVGMLAASLALFERLPKGADGARVREEFACALMAALIANEFCPSRRLQESAYITALFQNLGVMLAWLHLADEAREVEGRLAESCPEQAAASFQPSVSYRIDPDVVERVSREVMGVGYQDLGIEIARQWGWPEAVVHALRPLAVPEPETDVPPHDYVRAVCTAANRLAREVFGCPPEEREARLARFQAEWGHALALTPEQVTAGVERSLAEWAELAPVMSLPRPELLAATLGPAGAATGGKTTARDRPALRGGASRDAPAAPHARALSGKPANDAGRPATRPAVVTTRPDDPRRLVQLTAGIERLSLAALSDVSVAQLMQTFMQVLQEALHLRRVLICLRQRGPDRLEGRLGNLPEVTRLAAHFRVPLQPPQDLFGLLCLKGSDTLISDSSDPLIAARLPPWFHSQVRAASFLVLPLQRAGQVVGMVYADSPPAGQPLQITERELMLVKGLRNQVLMALQLREGARGGGGAEVAATV